MANNIAIRSAQGIVPFQIDFPDNIDRARKGSLHVFPATIYDVSEAEWKYISGSAYKDRFVKLETPRKKVQRPIVAAQEPLAQIHVTEKFDHETESHKKKK